MTERGARHAAHSETRFQLGPSMLAWQDDGSLLIHLDERGAPVPLPVRGTIRVRPRAWPATMFDLTGDGRHVWQPIAPLARAEVCLDNPNLAWGGSAYLDSNRGSEPLEDGFSHWNWSRFDVGGETIVSYGMTPRRSEARQLDLRFGADSEVSPLSIPSGQPMDRTMWGVNQSLPCDPGFRPRTVARFEDVPFYSRNHVSTRLHGTVVDGVHETFDGDRLRRGWVKALLPFRMPRRT